ncbi:hypothetical protein P8452_52353 [Trifolium repens]|nr:hypothetical protein P8452_52353 [Trifolium repens]
MHEKHSSSLITQKPFTIFLSKHRAPPCVILNPSLSRRHLEPQQSRNVEILKYVTRVNQEMIEIVVQAIQGHIIVSIMH